MAFSSFINICNQNLRRSKYFKNLPLFIFPLALTSEPIYFEHRSISVYCRMSNYWNPEVPGGGGSLIKPFSGSC